MDVVVTTSDPENVTESEIRRALELTGLYVNTVTIVIRPL
jgi:hypothetical protein